MREALRVLAEAGYLEARRGRGGGTFVAQLLPQLEARDPHDVLRELGDRLRDRSCSAACSSSASAELAAERATPVPTCERLAELIDEVAQFDAGALPLVPRGRLAPAHRDRRHLRLAAAGARRSPRRTASISEV